MRLRLQEYRKRAGLTGEGVAYRLGITQSSVVRHEHNPASVNIPRLYEYAEIYGCRPGDLLEDVDGAGVTDHDLLRIILEKVMATLKKHQLELKPDEFADVVTYLHERMTQVPGPDRPARLDVIVDELIVFARRESRIFGQRPD